MEKLINFANIVAWVSFVGSFLLICGRLLAKANYSELEEVLDRLQGRIVTFPITTPSFVLVVSVCWLLA